jgi:predicted RNA binding protein YcfA (HicA-like mRNA interferase family)
LPQCGNGDGVRRAVRFSELVRLLESNGFSLVKEKGSIRYYGLKAAGLKS